MKTMPDEDGNCELNALEDSVVDEDREPELYCEDCNKFFNLDGTPKGR